MTENIKEQYTSPELEIIEFKFEDIMTDSLGEEWGEPQPGGTPG